MGRTGYFGLSTFNAGERNSFPSEASWKYTGRDRDLMDSLFWAMLNHVHDGATATEVIPPTPELELVPAIGGVLEASTRYYYKITLVDESGLETGPSTEVYIDTPTQVQNPSAPAGITFATTGGVLLTGSYYYRLTAYVTSNTNETAQSPAAHIIIPVGTATNTISFEFPSLPTGADGWNVYRRKPNGEFAYLTSVDGVEIDFTDDGSIEDDCVRRPPQVNMTNRDNAVVVSFPGATPVVDEGYTWKVYRTTSPANYVQSLVAWVVEETFENSGIIVPEYTDLGTSSAFGGPPEQAIVIPHPPKINLDDMTEVEGSLPAGAVDHIHIQTFEFPGDLSAPIYGDMPFMWPFDGPARVLGVTCHLALGSTPVTDPVIVQVEIDGAPLWTDLSTQPAIDIGDTFSDTMVTPTEPSALVYGSLITANLDQDGGGASPFDYNLVVQVIIAYNPTYTGSETTEV